MTRVAVVDYGMGNVFSVSNALKHVGLEAVLVDGPDGIGGVDGIVIPGVGAMPDAMRTLGSQGLVEPLIAAGREGMPILGICLGFQLLMDSGTEFGLHSGLGLLPGRVEVLPSAFDSRGSRLRIPHVGWRSVQWVQSPDGVPHPFDSAGPDDEFYFVHSLYVQPDDDSIVVGRIGFGSTSLCAAARVGNVFGCQFHPERSGPKGIEILRRFAAIISPNASYPHSNS